MTNELVPMSVTGLGDIDDEIHNHWEARAGFRSPSVSGAYVNGVGVAATVAAEVSWDGSWYVVFSYSHEGEDDGFFAAIRTGYDQDWQVLEKGLLPVSDDPGPIPASGFWRIALDGNIRLGLMLEYAKAQLVEAMRDEVERLVSLGQ